MEADKKQLTGLRKRQQIAQANKTMFMWVVGAAVLSAPSAFTRQTGEAHWHVLLRARAIENGAFVIAAAQGGLHEDGRETYGHSLIVDPWGRVLAEAAHDEPAIIVAEIDTSLSAAARKKIPNLKNAREFGLAQVGRPEAALSGAAS
jgi:predicted amidohydrolase